MSPATSLHPASFPKHARLLRSGDFRRCFQQGKRLRSARLQVFLAPSPSDPDGAAGARLGLVVSRKVGPAVCRNRIKRHLREAFRQQRQHLGPWDIVVRVQVPRSQPKGTVSQAVPPLPRQTPAPRPTPTCRSTEAPWQTEFAGILADIPPASRHPRSLNERS